LSREEIEGWKATFKKFAPRILKATIWSLIVGIVFLVVQNLLSPFLFEFYPDSESLFSIFAWTIVVFTFLTKFSERTIYQYAFGFGRNFFLTIFFIYTTNGGILTVEAAGFLQASNLNLRLEFVPLVVLLVFGSIIMMVKDIIEAINFLTETST